MTMKWRTIYVYNTYIHILHIYRMKIFIKIRSQRPSQFTIRYAFGMKKRFPYQIAALKTNRVPKTKKKKNIFILNPASNDTLTKHKVILACVSLNYVYKLLVRCFNCYSRFYYKLMFVVVFLLSFFFCFCRLMFWSYTTYGSHFHHPKTKSNGQMK